MRLGDVVAGRFQLEAIAGTGGMGTVYLARDLAAGEPVALKTLSEVGQHEAARFAREAALLADLVHPGIVRYVAHGLSAEHQPFLAMEWLEGETLHRRMQRGAMSVADAVAVAHAIADALAAAHARGIVHRDIKPANVFLVGGDLRRVKVLDFGIARHVEQAGPALTHTGAVIGTPGYMAPEQVRGDSAWIGARTDVFALGCVLFRGATGQPAFGGGESLAVLAKILVDDVVPPSTLEPSVPRALDDLVLRMLAKSPQDRPADGAAVAAELARIVAETGLELPPRRPSGGDLGADTDPSSSSELSSATDATLIANAGGGITDTEQRLVSLVLAGAPATGAEVDPALVAAVATTFGGRVERIADGAHVVVFAQGGGVATDHAVRAARCALALRDAAPVAFVVASGRAAIGALAVGEVIDRAVPLLAGLASSQIAIDDATRALLDERFVIDARGGGGALLRGMRDGGEPARTLLGRATPMVGRDRELATLEALWAECVDEGVARAVLVTAPAGAGKSRLRQELVRRVLQRDEAAEILVGRGDPVAAGSPFALLADAIRRTAGVRAGDDLAAQRAALVARVGDERVAHLLGELAGVAFPSEASPALRAARADAVAKADAMRGAWVDWLAAECARHPVLLVLEDLHWGDRATVDYVDAALRRLASAPLMVVALARPDVHDQFPRLWHERELQEIRLAALTRKAGEKLARDLLGTAADAETIRRIVERAGGNAFFLEELIRAVAEGRDELPESVLAMLQQRLDALPADARRALRAASVFGEVFWRGGVAALTGADPRAHLQALVERELVGPNPTAMLPGEQEYAFRHDLVREAAYATMGDSDRALGHRLAGEWLVARGFSDALALAGHFSLGGDTARAAEQYARAAAQANDGGDTVAALGHAARGLACNPVGEVAGMLQLARAEAHGWRNEYAASMAAAAAAAAALPRGTRDWFRALDEQFYGAGRSGDAAAAMAVVGQLTTTAPEPGAGITQLRSVARAAIIMLRFGPPGVGPALVARTEQLASALTLDLASEQRLHAMRAFALRATGDAAGSLAEHEASLFGCRAVRNDRETAFTLLAYAGCYDELGDPDRARPLFAEGIAFADRVGATSVLGLLHMSRSLSESDIGDYASARVDAATAIATGDPAAAGIAHIVLARCAFAADVPDDALHFAGVAVAKLAAFGEYHAMALATRARILVALGDLDGARADATAARRAMRAHDGFQYGESLIRLVEIEVLEAARDPAAAAVRLEAAARLDARAAKLAAPWRASFLARPENAATLRFGARE